MTSSQRGGLLVEQAPPRVAVAPPPTRANAWEDVSDLSAAFGVTLDDWQDAVLQATMGERSDGTWAADVIGLSVPRQNGKSQLLVARALAGAILFGEQKIIISAHSQDTAREAFSKLLDMRDSSPELDSRIVKVMMALNREFVRFDNGSVIQFKARTVSGSRGFSCDCLLLDEAQILGMPAWVSIRSTMSARPNPQAWLMGTPPTPEDNGEVFTAVRASAARGKAGRTAWLEWSADPRDDPELESTRASANPAWHTRINHETVQGEFEEYPAERFALDRLGVWLDDQAASVLPKWHSCAVRDREPPTVEAIGLGVSLDEEWGSIAACGFWPDGVPNLGAVDRRPGSAWLVKEAMRIQRKTGCAVAIDEKCPDKALVSALEEAGVTLTVAKLEDYIEACSELRNRVREGQVTHLDSPELNDAVKAAAWRYVGDRRVIGRKQSTGHVEMLEAAVMALYGALQGLNYDVTKSVW